MPTQAIQWLDSYLTNRRQRTKCNGSVSAWCSVPSGVPQGSVLGPLLFCISMSSLKAVCSNTRIIKYADDVTLLHFIRDSSEDCLQTEMDSVASWSVSVGLRLNLSKCSVTNFITKKSICCSSIFGPSGEEIPNKETVKILGVTFSHDLRWKYHCDNIVKKACKRIFVIRNLKRSGCDPSLLFHVYRALIRSVLLYAYPCFCNAAQHLHESLYKVERRLFRMIFNNSFYEDNIEQASMNLCRSLFRAILCTDSHPLRCLFLAREPTHRNPCVLRPPRSRTKRFSNSFIKFCR